MNLSQRVVNFDPNDKNTLNVTRLVDRSPRVLALWTQSRGLVSLTSLPIQLLLWYLPEHLVRWIKCGWRCQRAGTDLGQNAGSISPVEKEAETLQGPLEAVTMQGDLSAPCPLPAATLTSSCCPWRPTSGVPPLGELLPQGPAWLAAGAIQLSAQMSVWRAPWWSPLSPMPRVFPWLYVSHGAWVEAGSCSFDILTCVCISVWGGNTEGLRFSPQCSFHKCGLTFKALPAHYEYEVHSCPPDSK